MLRRTLGRLFETTQVLHHAKATKQQIRALSAFQLHKITHEFDHILDANGDGIVDRSDIEDFKRKLRKYTDNIHGKAMPTTYKAGYEDYWILLHEFADANRDGRLSREEWVSMWTKIEAAATDTTFNSLPQWVRMLPSSLFNVIDSRGDGFIDSEEYRNFWYQVGGFPQISDERLGHCFNVMTEDGKYKLDIKRVSDLYADFYLSDDPSTPGRYIAGPIQYDELQDS